MKEEKQKRRFGDRKDARKVRKLDGMHSIMVDIKTERCDSDVYINQKIDVTNLKKFIEKRNKENKNENERITYFHAFATAIAKTIYNRPLLNRFVANRTYYDRNDVKLAFVAKIEFTDSSKELLTLLDVKENETLSDVTKIIKLKVNKIRNKDQNSENDDVNGLIDIIGALPKFLRVPIVGGFKFLDKHGWLPESIINDNIYYSSVIMSNLGSIKCGAIYHNLTNFGTNSILLTMGEVKKEKVLNENGKEEMRDICEIGINLDERIADGYYFAKSIALFQYIIDNPELLEGEANEKVEIK